MRVWYSCSLMLRLQSLPSGTGAMLRLPLLLALLAPISSSSNNGHGASLRVPRRSHPRWQPCSAAIRCAPPVAGVLFADQCGPGFSATDALGRPDHTCVLQAALNGSSSDIHTVVIRNVSASRPWVIGQLGVFRNDLEIRLERGAFLQSQRDYTPRAKHGGGGGCHSGHFLSLVNRTNITLRGVPAPNGARPTWRGWKWDHMNNTFGCGRGYSPRRMGLWLSSGPWVNNNTNTFERPASWKQYSAYGYCSGIRILNVNLEDSGGDGLYIEGCSSVHIANVSATGHIRQGASIIGCKDCLIEGSEFSRTFGAPPAAGIDLEPDAPNQDLTNITIRNCMFKQNHGSGINSWLNSWTLDQECEAANQHRGIKAWWFNCSATPLQKASITIEDCHVTGGPIANTSDGRSLADPSPTAGGFTFGRIGPTTAGGSIVIKDSSASELAWFGIYSWDHHVKGAALMYSNVTLTNVGRHASFVGISAQVSHIPCAPVGLDFLGGGATAGAGGACPNSSCVGNIGLQGITVVDDMPRSWLQVSGHYAPGTVRGSATVTNPHQIGCSVNVSGRTTSQTGLHQLPVTCHRSTPGVCSDATSWGAKGDGLHNDTASLQAAIDNCSQRRERLWITSGVFRITPLVLRSNLHLHLGAGATLLVDNNISRWPQKARHGSEGIPWRDVLSGRGITNVTLDGGGLIDGQGQVWYDLALAHLHNHSGALDGLRPRLVICEDCHRFALRGLRLLNSPCYNVFLSGSDCEVTGISIKSPPGAYDSPLGWLAPNTDGIDIACEGGYIARNHVVNGDDSLCVKSPGRDLLWEDNYVEQGNGIVIGTSNHSAMTNITYRNTLSNRTAYGAHIKFKGNQVGYVSGVLFENITVIQPYRYVIGIDQDSQNRRRRVLSSSTGTSPSPDLQLGRELANVSISDITFRDIRTVGQVQTAGLFICDEKKTGSSDDAPKGPPCTGIVMENVVIDSVHGCSYEGTVLGEARGLVEPPSCRNFSKPPATAKTAKTDDDAGFASPIIMGHRGCCADGTPPLAPENTLSAFKIAAEAGAHLIEMDLRLTKDGEIVCIHDPDFTRISNCTGHVADYTLARLRGEQGDGKMCDASLVYGTRIGKVEGLPLTTLAEALTLADEHNVMALLHVYPPGQPSGEQIAAVVQQFPNVSVIVGCNDVNDYAGIRTHLPNVPLGAVLPFDPTGALYHQMANDAFMKEQRAMGVSWLWVYSAMVVNVSGFTVAAHKRGLMVYADLGLKTAWHPGAKGNQTDVKVLMSESYDGLTTDDPSAVIGWVREARRSCGFVPRPPPPPPTSAAPSYPIHASWFGDRSTVAWQSTLAAASKVGIKQVWQFANPVEPSQNVSALQKVVPAAANAISQLATKLGQRGVTVSGFFSHSSNTLFSAAAMQRCPTLDSAINDSQGAGWVLALAAVNESVAGAPCTFVGAEAAIMLVWTPRQTWGLDDMSEILLTVADKTNTTVLLGLPTQPTLHGWDPILTAVPFYLDFLSREIEFRVAQTRVHPSLTGYYQGLEVSLFGQSDKPYTGGGLHEAFQQVNDLIHARSDLLISYSPYWDTNRNQDVSPPMENITLQQSIDGLLEFMNDGFDIIAPQEGRGTGKTALWWPHEANLNVSSVDPVLGSNSINHFYEVHGSRSFAAQWWASSRQLMRAARTGVDQALSQRGARTRPNFELWFNLEAFDGGRGVASSRASQISQWHRSVAVAGAPLHAQTPVVGCTPCAGGILPRTCKQRIDRSLTHAGAFPTKIISFMWDNLYDCASAPCSCVQSLSQQIAEDGHRPILSTAAIHQANKSLEIRGFNLQVAGDTVLLNITCQGGGKQAASLSAELPLESVEVGFGAVVGLVPALQRGWSALPPWAPRCVESRQNRLALNVISASRGAATWLAFIEGN